MSQDEIFKLATKIYQFMMDTPAPGMWDYAYENESEMAYAEALAKWRESGKNPIDFFSTEDPDMIALRDSFKKEFGLEVVSREEGLKRVAHIMPVCGWLN